MKIVILVIVFGLGLLIARTLPAQSREDIIDLLTPRYHRDHGDRYNDQRRDREPRRDNDRRERPRHQENRP